MSFGLSFSTCGKLSINYQPKIDFYLFEAIYGQRHTKFLTFIVHSFF